MLWSRLDVCGSAVESRAELPCRRSNCSALVCYATRVLWSTVVDCLVGMLSTYILLVDLDLVRHPS